MLQLSAFYVLLITFTVSVSAKLHSDADNTTETGSSVSELYTESSVVNDNICNNHEKNVAFDVILFDNKLPPQQGGKKSVNKRQAPRDNRKDYKDRPRPDQKSLLIVFDATASMHDDLEQLRAGAQEIVSELSARDDNPIFNYVLVVYRDPSECFALSAISAFNCGSVVLTGALSAALLIQISSFTLHSIMVQMSSRLLTREIPTSCFRS